MSVRLDTPVLVIGFNRPDLVIQVFERLRVVKPHKIYFAVDGARNSKEDKVVEMVRRAVVNVDWKCEVKTKFQKQNLGCKYGPVAAMNWFFENEEMGIILEDDVLADESFFYFCSELLDKYKDNNRVGSISGNNFQFGKNKIGESYYFSRYSHSCGWATWRRAWKKFDIEIAGWRENNSVLDKVFDRWIDKLYWSLIFEGVVSGEIDSAWDYQWNYMMWSNEMWGIIPANNLVNNVGFGRADATHTKFKSKFESIDILPMNFPLVHPKEIKLNRPADDLTQNQNYVLWKEMGMSLIRKWNRFKETI